MADTKCRHAFWIIVFSFSFKGRKLEIISRVQRDENRDSQPSSPSFLPHLFFLVSQGVSGHSLQTLAREATSEWD